MLRHDHPVSRIRDGVSFILGATPTYYDRYKHCMSYKWTHLHVPESTIAQVRDFLQTTSLMCTPHRLGLHTLRVKIYFPSSQDSVQNRPKITITMRRK